MNNKSNNARRSFLKGTVLSAAAAFVPLADAWSEEQSARLPAAHMAMPETQMLEVVVRGDLSGSEVNLELVPGSISQVIQFSGRRAFKISATPVKMDERFGQIYSLVLADKEGKVLEKMNVAGNTTATFSQYGVQIYLVSIAQAT